MHANKANWMYFLDEKEDDNLQMLVLGQHQIQHSLRTIMLKLPLRLVLSCELESNAVASVELSVDGNSRSSTIKSVSDVGFYWFGFSSTCGGVLNSRPVWNPVPGSLTAREKFDRIQGYFRPNHHFLFPERVQVDGKRRRFKLSWLEEYPWLVYSKKCNAGFCLPACSFQPTILLSVSCIQVHWRILPNSKQRVIVIIIISINSVTKFLAFKGVMNGESGTDIVQQFVDVSGKQCKENIEKFARSRVQYCLLWKAEHHFARASE